jgi:hypothetical protein
MVQHQCSAMVTQVNFFQRQLFAGSGKCRQSCIIHFLLSDQPMFDRIFDSAASRRLGKLLTALFIIATCQAGGCSKDEMKKMAATAQNKASSLVEATKEKATQAVAEVKKQLPPTGEIKLNLSPPLEISAANIEVTSIGDGRPNVVQIANYDLSGSPTSYPSILIRGTTEVGDPASLAGQSVSCDLFIQEDSSAPVAMTKTGTPVEIKFSSFDPQNKTISASISAVDLVQSDNRSVQLGGGSIVATVAGGGS